MLKLKGGTGSGNFGHSGRLGKRGGSSPNISLAISNLGYDKNILDGIAKRKKLDQVVDYLKEFPDREKYLEAFYQSKSFTSGDEEGRSIEGFNSIPLSDLERSLNLANQGRLPSRGYMTANFIPAYIISKLPESSIDQKLYRGSNWEGELRVGNSVSFEKLGREFSTIDPQVRGGSPFGSRKYIFVKESGKAVDLRDFSNHPEEQPFLVRGDHKVIRIEGNRVYIE